MSIYATWLSIEDERQWMAEMEGHGIEAGVIRDGEPVPEDLDAPIIYEGSHVLPSDNNPRGGSVDVAAIPHHIERNDHPQGGDGQAKPWLRLSVQNPPSKGRHAGQPYVKAGDAALVLTQPQVLRLRDTLSEWLDYVARDAEPEQVLPDQPPEGGEG